MVNGSTVFGLLSGFWMLAALATGLQDWPMWPVSLFMGWQTGILSLLLGKEEANDSKWAMARKISPRVVSGHGTDMRHSSGPTPLRIFRSQPNIHVVRRDWHGQDEFGLYPWDYAELCGSYIDDEPPIGPVRKV